MERKICKICNINKPISDYNLAGKGKYFQSYCKPCDSERKKVYNEKNKERLKEKYKQNYEKNKKLVDPIQKEINIKKTSRKRTKTSILVPDKFHQHSSKTDSRSEKPPKTVAESW